ncbi:MAG: guanylate kinase [Myxococcota bacterium]|nr:guanylate kinase [Myxococcota bacterium]
MDDLVLLILCSPSGAGKTTLTRHLLDNLRDFTFSVSHTTRKPRAGEVDGREYHFVDRVRFQELIACGEFAEWAEVHGNLYGTSVREIERARVEGMRGIVFDVDYQGARQIKAKLREAIGVFVLPPSMDELRRRLEGRGTEDESTIQRRFQKAWIEIEHYGFFDFLVVNDDLVRAQAAVLGIALAERHRRWRLAPAAEALLKSGR